jgi:hypothetical protein
MTTFSTVPQGHSQPLQEGIGGMYAAADQDTAVVS